MARGLCSGTIAILVLAVLASPGCYHTIVKTSATRAEVRESEIAWHLLWGLVAARVDASECKNGLAKMTTTTPWWSCLVVPLTIGIASPQRVQYTCAAPPAYAPPVAPPAYAPPAAAPPPPAPAVAAGEKTDWRVKAGSRIRGPWPLEDVQRGIAAGWIKAKTLVRWKGSSKWVPAGEVPELFPPAP